MPTPSPEDRTHPWRADITLAFGFLTRLPVRAPHTGNAGMLARALRLSPAVGAFIGALAGSFYWLAVSFGFSTFIAAITGIIAATIVTGGLHEDALSDMVDGFSGGWTRERVFEIMSDGRIGAHGALAMMLALLLRIGAMAQLSTADRVMAALIAAGALSRAMMYVAMAALPYAKSTGLGHDAGRPDLQQTAAALALGFAIAWLALPFGTALAAFIGAAVGALITARLAMRRIGGQTGDILGAVQQISEIFALLLLAGVLTN